LIPLGIEEQENEKSADLKVSGTCSSKVSAIQHEHILCSDQFFLFFF
jgi:hypothetical protein